MGDGGFLVKFDGKAMKRCYAISVNYDTWECTYNLSDTVALPDSVKTITIEVETSPEGER